MFKKTFFSVLIACGFILGIQDGCLALWRDGTSDPVQVFPYRAENLPIADQKALQEGIHLDDDSQLAQLLEDYLS